MSRKPAPEPLDVDGVLVVGAGSAVWFVLFVVLLALHDRLADTGHLLWLWTSLAGWILGLLGTVLCIRQRATRRAGHE